ncbi:hypothetical protein ACFXPR_18095 [Nocardia tengchongensis]|uniref:hypothetical protein n=1 Tax=Nocardia tengchongensis TaxID=2055889 RepID=UPI00369813DF
MTSRSRQAAKLAQLLSERTGRTGRHYYDGPRKYGGWNPESWTSVIEYGLLPAVPWHGPWDSEGRTDCRREQA